METLKTFVKACLLFRFFGWGIFRYYYMRGDMIHVKWRQNSIYLRRYSSDNVLFKNIFINKEYDISCDFIPEVIVDCGANIGLATVFFKDKYPSSKIFTIEPDVANFNMLQRNTATYSDIYLIHAGIWSRSTNLCIKDLDSPSWAFQVEESESGSISAISIMDIIDRYQLSKIDVLKIDIEGSEVNLFSGNLEWLQYVKVLMIELHDQWVKNCSKVFFRALDKYEYRIFLKGENIVVIFDK